MSSKPDKGLCNKYKYKKEEGFNHYGVCRCCDAPPIFIIKKIKSVTKIKSYINLPKKNLQTTINQTFQRANRRKEN